MLNQEIELLFKGFSKLSKAERLTRLMQMGALTAEDVATLTSTQALPTSLAENFIENVMGYFAMPLGVAVNFCIDGRCLPIPMAVEETSIIAAASKTAKWIKDYGNLHTKITGSVSIGQVQFAVVKNFPAFKTIVHQKKAELIAQVNATVAAGLVARGGGVEDLVVRELHRPDGKTMAIIHVLVNTCNAMGANIINQICEYLKIPLEKYTGEEVALCILSNLNDQKLITAEVVLEKIDPQLGHKIAEAGLFAELDPYRAATNNKGVLNGMDAVLLATGNDWRAVEAGVHAYAARSGQYRSITHWRMQDGDLHGTLTAPISVGIVGGVTRLHPTAQICLNMLKVKTADDLARIVAAVGLVQNLGALRALTTVGIIEGHMKLHIANLILNTGAQDAEIPILQDRLEQILIKTKRISMRHALDVLAEIRR